MAGSTSEGVLQRQVEGRLKVTELGRYVYALCAWLGLFKSWLQDLIRRMDA